MSAKDDLIVSVSGIRGIVGSSLTPDVALRFAQALGSETNGGAILLSRDGRPSGGMLGQAVSAGLLSVGCRVMDLGIQPTPTVGVAVTHFHAAGAIQISASHNPAPYNGLKLFGPDGAVLSPAEGKKVVARFQQNAFSLQDALHTGQYTSAEQLGFTGQPHLDRILEAETPGGQTNANSKPLRVLVDVNHGAGGTMAQKVLAAYGVEPILIDAEPTGLFSHEAEPTAAHLQSFASRIVKQGAEVGFALDPDADRLAIIDEKGRYIGEELTLALVLAYRLQQGQGPVVINMSTSRVNEIIAQAHDCRCLRSAVGEANVVAAMREHEALIGGEGNGGVIDPRVGWVRDPFIAMAIILKHLQATGQPLSAWVDALPALVIVKDKYPLDRARLPELYEQVMEEFGGWSVDRQDGLRLDGPNGWLHLRPSNTEPIVRVIAESTAAAEAKQLCTRVEQIIKAMLG